MTPDDILALLTGTDDADLFARADDTRQYTFGNTVCLQAVISISNVCTRQCTYCTLRADNRALPRYRLKAKDVLDAARKAAAQDATTVVLQSGEDTGLSVELIGELTRKIKTDCGVSVTLALGDRSLDEYAYLRDCGADACLLKLETCDRNRYKQLHESEDLASRLHRLEGLRNLGYSLGSGIIAGLPGTTPIDALRDILFLTDLHLDLIETGPFVPQADTPLAGNPPGSIILSQRVAALLRLLNPLADIPAPPTLDALRPGSCAESLERGCNVLMADMIPADKMTANAVRVVATPSLENDMASLAPLHRTIAAKGLVPSASKTKASGREHVG
ncbi:biotin synthase BioB [Pseudodesulfovibrio sp.]|uniref:biotin synthase BioB n=1 Tax=unclassified Pseudodesulfovibrio TaxID=2661612 RepID=UPI003B00FFF0